MINSNEKGTLVQKRKGLKIHIVNEKNPTHTLCSTIFTNECEIEFKGEVGQSNCRTCSAVWDERIMDAEMKKEYAHNTALSFARELEEPYANSQFLELFKRKLSSIADDCQDENTQKRLYEVIHGMSSSIEDEMKTFWFGMKQNRF